MRLSFVLELILVTIALWCALANAQDVRKLLMQHKTGASMVEVVQTARDTGDRLTPKMPVPWIKSTGGVPPGAHTVVKFDRKQQYQQIIGWGCALTEAAAYTYSTMNTANQKKILDLYFSPMGLNYTIGRLHMNSCDFSIDNYSCDDVEGDYQLQNFNIARDKKYIVPFVQAAINNTRFYNPKHQIQFFLSPWSPPAWMKINKQMDGSAQPNGLINSTTIYQSWALFYSKFIKSYKQEGVDIWGLTVQNESEFAAPWEACVYTPQAQRDFVKNYLGPMMKANHPNVKLMVFDHNRDHVHDWAKVLYSDPEASKYIDGMAFHWYSDENYQNLVKAYNQDPSKFLLSTESCHGPGVELGDWPRAEAYGYDIINDLQAFASGWTEWNCILDWQGGPNHLKNYCDASIIGDARSQQVHIQPMYYYMGHFSKYFKQGSRRIDIQQKGDSVLATAVQTPEGYIAAVLQNKSDSLKTIAIQDSTLGDSYYAVIVMPPRSIQTVLYA